MTDNGDGYGYGYGLWLLVVFNSLLFIVFAAMFTFSSLVIGPAISGGDTKTPPGVERPADHASHHK